MASTAANVITVSDIFNSMDYGAVLESDSLAQDWIKNKKFGFFIDGEIATPKDRKTFDVINPNTGIHIATVLEPNEDDVNQAVASAHKAFKAWGSIGEIRAQHLYRIARNIQKQQHLFNITECIQTGKTINEVKNFDIPQIVRLFYYYAGLAELLRTESATEEPHGVTVVLAHWNFPVMQIARMVAPALAAGNTVIVKVAGETPLSAYLLADIIKMSKLPSGVFNLISGTDKKITKHLLEHDIVKKISFIGSEKNGIEIRRVTAGMDKHLSLELDGKCAFIVFDNVDQDSLVEEIINASFFHNGQSNFAASRLLIQETIFHDIISKLKIRMNKLRVGNGMDKIMDLGAIINEKQINKINSYVEKAKQDGAKVFQMSNSTIASGNYFPPTLITDIDPGSPVVLEEIFGPVLVAFPFRTTKESISLANNTAFGMAASVFTENNALAMEVASSLKVGTVWINCYNVFDAAAPFGGCKRSGYGRHGGKEGLYEYLKGKQKEKNELPSISEIAKSLNPRTDVTYKMYIGGVQTRPDGNTSRKIFSPKDELLALVGEGSRKDIRNAVEAAQKAQIGWAKRTGHNRAQILYYIAENLEKRRSQFTEGDSYGIIEFTTAVHHIFHWAACCDKFAGSVNETISSYTNIQINEPVGVIGISCPESWPLLSFVTLVSMAIALGNTVVVIPNKMCPMPALDLIQVFDTSDVPGGVINIVTGDQNILAETLAQHHDVNALWYFGNIDGRKKMEHESAENSKRTWIADENSIDWIQLINGNNYLHNAINCKSIWLPMGESYAN